MIITKMEKSQEVFQLAAQVSQPDPEWRYERSDKLVVKWQKDGEHWHIPHLVKKSRLAEPQYADGEQHNEGEMEEYYIDPTNDAEVTPKYVSRMEARHIPGHVNYECAAWLTVDEIKWMSPAGTGRPIFASPTEYKRKIAVWRMGASFVLHGVWVGNEIESRDGLSCRELHVDRAELLEGWTSES